MTPAWGDGDLGPPYTRLEKFLPKSAGDMLLWGRVALTTDPVTSSTAIELMTYLPPNDQKRLESYRISSRKPVRLTTTVSWSTHQALINRSNQEGRSLSNLMSYILETSL
jgi:hypothetical protein